MTEIARLGMYAAASLVNGKTMQVFENPLRFDRGELGALEDVLRASSSQAGADPVFSLGVERHPNVYVGFTGDFVGFGVMPEFSVDLTDNTTFECYGYAKKIVTPYAVELPREQPMYERERQLAELADFHPVNKATYGIVTPGEPTLYFQPWDMNAKFGTAIISPPNHR